MLSSSSSLLFAFFQTQTRAMHFVVLEFESTHGIQLKLTHK